MSVPVFKRNESSIEFLHTYHKLRKEVNILIARDFGIKPRTYTINLVSKIYELNEEDERTLTEISEKYGMNSVVVEKYPQWLINSLRNETRECTRHIGVEIELANSIFIYEGIARESYAERRKIKAMSKRGIGEEISLSQFKSWRGAIVSRYGEYKSIRSIDEYYNKHYGKRTN